MRKLFCCLVARRLLDDKTACTTCHDSHGVENAVHLINFNTTYVTPSASGPIQYNSTGFLHGNCTLTCHGKDHQATPLNGGSPRDAVWEKTTNSVSC